MKKEVACAGVFGGFFLAKLFTVIVLLFVLGVFALIAFLAISSYLDKGKLVWVKSGVVGSEATNPGPHETSRKEEHREVISRTESS